VTNNPFLLFTKELRLVSKVAKAKFIIIVGVLTDLDAADSPDLNAIETWTFHELCLQVGGNYEANEE